MAGQPHGARATTINEEEFFVSGTESVIVDNPSVVVEPASPAVGTVAEGSGSPALDAPENNYDPLTATRADRVAALTQRLLGADAPAAEPEPEPEPQAAAPAAEPEPATDPESQAEVPDKFRLPDGSINPAFVKSYQSMESMYTKQSQQINELTQAVLNLQGQLLTSQAAPQYTPPEPPAPTPEELAAANEAWLERFYENPQVALGEIIANAIDSQVKPVLAPVRAEMEFQQSVQTYSQQVAQLSQKYPDLDQYRPAMQEILSASAEDPAGGLDLEAILSQDGGMEVIYLMAKGKAPAPPAVPPNKAPEELLKDQAFLAQVVSNPEIQKMIFANIQSQVKGEPAPPVVGARSGGTAPGLEPVSIKNTKDAARASRSYFQKAFGGTL